MLCTKQDQESKHFGTSPVHFGTGPWTLGLVPGLWDWTRSCTSELDFGTGPVHFGTGPWTSGLVPWTSGLGPVHFGTGLLLLIDHVISTFVVSCLDHCLTFNLTAVQSLYYSALSILVKSLLAYI